MQVRILLVFLISFMIVSCSGDKHLPSSNPPEYDPKKVYTPPATSPITTSFRFALCRVGQRKSTACA